MADLTAADVKVTMGTGDMDLSPDPGGRRVFPKIVFGDGSKKYPALGIPLPAIGKFGLLFEIKRAYVEQPANGYIYHFDRANNKLRIFQGIGGNGGVAVTIPAHTHDLKVIGGAAPNESVGVNGGDTLSKTAAVDRTIAGADSATKGGVVAATLSGTVAGGAGAASPFVELGNEVVAETTLYLELVGK
jgi:hypothetical protein